MVSRDDLERGLARLGTTVDDRRHGIYGPGSHAWRLNREALNFLGGGRAALLQLAHPYVAHAIDQHSATRSDVLGRFRRTFANVFAMTFGDLDSALRSARRVHGVHGRVTGIIDEDIGALRRGHAYRANDLDALTWVHATLIDTVLEVRRLCFGPLDPTEADAYYQETKRFALLFGIPSSRLPVDYPAFAAYVDDMLASGTLAVSRAARITADQLFVPPHRLLAPVASWYRRVTGLLLPAELAEGFALPVGVVDRAAASASIKALALAWPVLPRQLRYLPAYLAAEQRVGSPRGGPIARAATRLAMTGYGVWPRPTR